MAGTKVAMVSPAEMAARTVARGAVRVDAFESLLVYAGLDNRWDLPPSGQPLMPNEAARLLGVLLGKPVTLAHFPPRMGANHLLREVVEGGEVSREELLRRVKRLERVAVLRPDGYLAWVVDGKTQQKVAPVEWRDGAFRAHGFELGRFYASRSGVFRLADAQMQQTGPLLAEVYDDADYISRTLDGAEEAFVELALAIGKLLTYPMDSLAAIRHLPAGLVALIVSSPEYLERLRHMTRGEQVKAISKLATTLIVTYGTASGATRTLTAALGGAEAMVPVLSLTAEGALVMQRIAVPVGTMATVIGTGAGSVYVLSTASSGDGPDSGRVHAGGEAPQGSANGTRAGKVFTTGGKRQIDAENAARNGGVNKCENCGVKVVPGQKSQRGVSPPAHQRERDHIIPKSQGGDGAPSNGQILCRGCNLEKSDTGP
ncbi:MAG TPA: HNH endonuclease signature motif containing protein [Hyalangium sp.]|nr:HNH endonuclease signature motif containing protein [Hyalangium sp.]